MSTLETLRPGAVVLVGGGPGDAGLMTVAGRAAVEEADVLLVDHLAPAGALEWARPDAEIIDVSKLPRGAFTSQERINELLVEHARAGRRVVRLKGGDGFVFGRGMEELEACSAAGVPVRVVPGVSASVAVPALAGIPMTHRGLVQGFTVISGHVPPDHPTNSLDYAALAASGTTLVVLMGVATLGGHHRRAPRARHASGHPGGRRRQRRAPGPADLLVSPGRHRPGRGGRVAARHHGHRGGGSLGRPDLRPRRPRPPEPHSLRSHPGDPLMPQGQPPTVPDDGLTTRQRRNRPLLMVHTGDGKGKSTAAFGLALRGWNQGWPVGVFQFVKSAKWRIGEETVLERSAAARRDRRGRPGRVAQDGRRLVVDPAAGQRRRPRRGRPREGWSRSSATWPPRPTTSTCSTSSPTR